MVSVGREAAKFPEKETFCTPRLDVIVEFLLVGAVAIGVGTVNFWDPCVCEKLVDALERWCPEHRVQSIRELIGGLIEPS